MADRHEALRTVFPEAGGEPVGAPGTGGEQQAGQDTVLRRPTGEQGTVPDLVTALEEQNAAGERRSPDPENPGRNQDGSPTPENPAFSLATLEIAGDPQRVSTWLGETVEAPLEDIKVEWVSPHGTPGILAAQFQTPSGLVRL